MINGGYQPSTTGFDDSFTFALYQETGTTEISYDVGAGAIFEGGAAVRVWKGLALGGVISHFSVDSPGSLTSSVPHPFFLERYRQVTGEPEGVGRLQVVARRHPPLLRRPVAEEAVGLEDGGRGGEQPGAEVEGGG